MKFCQAAIVALLASTVNNVVNAEEDCTSIVDLACSTDGFSTLCSVLTDVAPALDPDVVASLKTVFAPTVSHSSFVFFYCIPSSVDRSAIESSVVSTSSSILDLKLHLVDSVRYDRHVFALYFSSHALFRYFSFYFYFIFNLHFHFFIRMMHLLLLNLI